MYQEEMLNHSISECKQCQEKLKDMKTFDEIWTEVSWLNYASTNK